MKGKWMREGRNKGVRGKKEGSKRTRGKGRQLGEAKRKKA